jgi:carbonic anhydrase
MNVGAILFAAALLSAAEPAPHPAPTPTPTPTPQMIFDWLDYGNQRHAEGRPAHWHQSSARRREVARAERPQAAILTCADSSVPAEILFDQGIGDLFVVRVFGNTAGERELAALEHAVANLDVPLVVVLGHQRCSAVAGAIRGSTGGRIGAIHASMAAPLALVKGQPGDVLERAVFANVENGVATLLDSEPILAPRAYSGRLRILGAVYDPDSGRVRWVAPKTRPAALSAAKPH